MASEKGWTAEASHGGQGKTKDSMMADGSRDGDGLW